MELIELDGRKTQGRQKIEIKPIEDESDRLITFSKRRTGIYKKANELATLTHAMIGIVIFSPTGKPFSLGHPYIDLVLERYASINISKEPLNEGDVQPDEEDEQTKAIEELNEQLDEANSELEAEKKHGKARRGLIKASREANPATGTVGWWEAKIKELSIAQVDEVFAPMEDFYTDAVNHLNKLLAKE